MQYAAIIRVIVEIFPLVSHYCLKFCTGFGLVRVNVILMQRILFMQVD